MSEYTNVNQFFNDIARGTGVPIGDWDKWMMCGPAPETGSSGQAACDGWTHKHKMTNAYREGVIANYCDRRSFYNDAPHRQYGPPYPGAGRPDGWTPEMRGDNSDGSFVLAKPDGMPLLCTSLDVEHFWLNPLFELHDDDNPIDITMPDGKQVPSNVVARNVINYYLRSIAGQIRDPEDPQLPLIRPFGDRSNSRILDTYIESGKRAGSIETFDAVTLDLWVRHAMLPFYESGAGITHFGKGEQPINTFTIGVFNGLGWILPTCYNAAEAVPASPLKDRLMKLVQRWSQWMLDIEKKWPAAANPNLSRVHMDREWMMGGPRASLEEGLAEASAEWGGGNFDGYTFRAIAVAAEVTGDPVMKAEYERRKTALGGTTKPEDRVWLVDENGTPI